jgi:hypothetical protein
MNVDEQNPGDTTIDSLTDEVDVLGLDALWQLVAAIATKRGEVPICDLPGAWHLVIDEKPRWELWCNGHRERIDVEVAASWATSAHRVTIDPATIYIEYNGWPAGLLTPMGGMIAAGAEGNLRTLVAAVRRHYEAL